MNAPTCAFGKSATAPELQLAAVVLLPGKTPPSTLKPSPSHSRTAGVWSRVLTRFRYLGGRFRSVALAAPLGVAAHLDQIAGGGSKMVALGLGEGGEQNAPLGRAVIGGLLCATVATLAFVPAVFGWAHGRRATLGPV